MISAKLYLLILLIFYLNLLNYCLKCSLFFIVINKIWGLGIGDWGLGFGGFGVWAKNQNPKPKTQKPKTKKKKIKNFYIF